MTSSDDEAILLGRFRRRPILGQAVLDGLLVGLWVATLGLATYAVLLHARSGLGMDAHAYWVAVHSRQPYGIPPGTADAYLYSPLFVQVLHPFTALPWSVFCGLWLVMEATAFAWLLHPLPLRWKVPAFAFVLPEVLVGNIHALLAMAVVLGVRRPEGWVFPALTKVSPVGPGLLYLAARAEWVRLTRAVLAIVTLVGVSFALQPDLWRSWVVFLMSHRGDDPVTVLCLPVAAVVTLVAARRRATWLLVVAVWLTLPKATLLDPHSLTVLAGIPRLLLTPLDAPRRDRSSAVAAPGPRERP